ncbi:MAG: hypothetical protein M1823_006957, partial [Watsoniomyces obsoletus]
MYGEHTLDKLYSEVDPSGYLTPGIGLSTPGTPCLHSRQASQENLRSFNALTNGNAGSSTPNGGSVNPAALEYRLQNLHIRPSSLGQEDPGIQVHPASEDASRRNSDPHVGPEGQLNPHDTSASRSHPTISPNDATAESSFASASRRVSEEEDGYQSGARTPFPQYAHTEDLAR